MRAMFVPAALLALAACGQAGSNPLIGEWEVTPTDPGMSAMMAMVPPEMRMMVFTDSEMKVGGETLKVTYTVESSSKVVVTPEGKTAEAFEVVSIEGKTCLKMPAEAGPMRICRKG